VKNETCRGSNSSTTTTTAGAAALFGILFECSILVSFFLLFLTSCLASGLLSLHENK
jgi:hypothetical protein